MPRWTTHTEGGSWYGGGTSVTDCSSAMQTAITNCYNSFMAGTCLDAFPGLKDCIREIWATIEIDCNGPQCDGNLGVQQGNKISVCVGVSSGLVCAELVHELTHACGGTELDCEAVEWACYNGIGVSVPSGEDWEKFRDETVPFGDSGNEYCGRYVIWNSDTGEVWTKRETHGVISKGPLIFKSSSFECSYTDGGSWF